MPLFGRPLRRRQCKLAASQTAESLNEESVLTIRDAFCERRGRIIGQDRYATLRDDRSVVIPLIYAVNRNAAEPIACSDDCLVYSFSVHALATVLWEKGGVAVEDSATERVDRGLSEQSHVAEEKYDIDPMLHETRGDRVIAGRFVGVFAAADPDRRDAAPASECEHPRLRVVADHDCDAGVDDPGPTRLHDRLGVAASV